MRISSLFAFSVLVPALAIGADLSSIAGHYRYEQYSVTLPSQKVLSLSDMGATEAFLDISTDGTITVRMTMKAGNVVTETAKVLDAHFVGQKGYWIAQWPEMTSPVRAEISPNDGGIVSDTHFDDKSDRDRYGSVEHAVLRKVAAK
jgi:hypothetical protein